VGFGDARPEDLLLTNIGNGQSHRKNLQIASSTFNLTNKITTDNPTVGHGKKSKSHVPKKPAPSLEAVNALLQGKKATKTSQSKVRNTNKGEYQDITCLYAYDDLTYFSAVKSVTRNSPTKQKPAAIAHLEAKLDDSKTLPPHIRRVLPPTGQNKQPKDQDVSRDAKEHITASVFEYSAEQKEVGLGNGIVDIKKHRQNDKIILMISIQDETGNSLFQTIIRRQTRFFYENLSFLFCPSETNSFACHRIQFSHLSHARSLLRILKAIGSEELSSMDKVSCYQLNKVDVARGYPGSIVPKGEIGVLIDFGEDTEQDQSATGSSSYLDELANLDFTSNYLSSSKPQYVPAVVNDDLSVDSVEPELSKNDPKASNAKAGTTLPPANDNRLVHKTCFGPSGKSLADSMWANTGAKSRDLPIQFEQLPTSDKSLESGKYTEDEMASIMYEEQCLQLQDGEVNDSYSSDGSYETAWSSSEHDRLKENPVKSP
jgi:hypothetical protein